jgi:hypothetical protein
VSSASVRHFFVSDDSEIFRVPNAKFERLLKGLFEKKIERFAVMKDGGIVANAGFPDIFGEKVQGNLINVHIISQ